MEQNYKQRGEGEGRDREIERQRQTEAETDTHTETETEREREKNPCGILRQYTDDRCLDNKIIIIKIKKILFANVRKEARFENAH